MSWDPRALLFAFVLLHALAALLLLLGDRIRAWWGAAETAREAADGAIRPDLYPEGSSVTDDWPRAQAEQRLLASLQDWRERETDGEFLPHTADVCRSERPPAPGSHLRVRG